MGWRKHVVATTQSWLDEGLEPRAITRDMEGYGVSLPIGYEIPGEAGKVIYVWFEAVIGYLSASVELSLRSGHENNILAGKVLNYNLESTAIISDTYKGQSLNWEEYWFSPTTKSYYFMGKDNIPFHSIIWTAMLLGLNLNLNTPGNVVANQYLNLKGAKFSKSTGNNIDTVKFWEKFGETSSRYYLLSRSPENKDYDFTFSEFVAATNNELGANVGNLVNRTLVFWNKQFASSTHADVVTSPAISEKIKLTYEIVEKLLLECNFVEALKEILEFSSFGNRVFNDSQIWQVIKTDEQKAFQSMFDLLQIIANLARLLLPFLPEFSEQIHSYLSLTLPVNEVGSNNWLPLTYLVSKLGLILNVQPLIKKLELSDEN